MKKRATSILLATLAVVSFVLPALAADDDGTPEEPPVVSTEPEQLQNAIVLDGEAAESVEFEIRDGVCYVTVSSFVTLMDPEAMVEEEDGKISVNATRLIEVIDLDKDEAGAGEAGGNTADILTAELNLTTADGGAYLEANGRYLYAGDGISTLNGSVAAPVRLMARVYNLGVDYDAEHNLVLLWHQEDAEPYLNFGEYTYDGDMLYWLSRIINAESGNQSLEGKIAVGNVVMNRVNDPKFPNNIHDVLFQKNQFTPAISGSIYKEPNAQSILAAKLVMDGAQVTPTALFFNQVGLKCYASKTRTYVTTIGCHAFYK